MWKARRPRVGAFLEAPPQADHHPRGGLCVGISGSISMTFWKPSTKSEHTWRTRTKRLLQRTGKPRTPSSEILRSSVRPQEIVPSKYKRVSRRSIGARLQGYATFSFMSISASICQLYGMWFKTNWVCWKQFVEDFLREPPNRLTRRLNSM